jgi:hypothetical protein
MEYIDSVKSTIERLILKHGEKHRDRIVAGVNQVAALWRGNTGEEPDLMNFCLEAFVVDPGMLDSMYKTFEKNYESMQGGFTRMLREITEPIYVETGEILPIDYLFAGYLPSAHFIEDMFRCRIAFCILLNFPRVSLQEKLKHGGTWSRKQWAYARIADIFTTRIPAETLNMQNLAYINAQNYINRYNLYMGTLLDERMTPLFPETLRLISHWGLRDELKAQYKNDDGLKRQEYIYRVMVRIIEQSIPEAVIDSHGVFWNPVTNNLYRRTEDRVVPCELKAEKSGRYHHLLTIFKAEKKVDAFCIDAPSLIERRFDKERQIPERVVEELFVSLCSSPVLQSVAHLIQKKLGRPLQPFDIWYNGFSTNTVAEHELDSIVTKAYPTLQDFWRAIPDILMKMGFTEEKAGFIHERIVVDPARGAGHALAPGMRDDKAYLRTRVPLMGMNYKGYNVAMHELGHCVEQTFSMHNTGHFLLANVPNTAFTECFAFMFQKRDLTNLGLEKASPNDAHFYALKTLWDTFEIAGVALVDMKVWRYMYDNPDIDELKLKEAVIRIATDIWNCYYAPVFGMPDVPLLAIYSHIIDAGMYLPDYPLGHVIAFQVEKFMEGRNLGTEMERMCSIGYVTPRYWMHNAVGADISTEPLLKAAAEALSKIKQE